MLSDFVRTVHELYAVRFLLGLAEAGYFPGIVLILEGVPAIVGGVLTYFLLPSRSAEAKFLTSEEKDWITTELSREEREKLTSGRVTARRALMHGRVWHLSAIYFCQAVGFYSMIFWMPQFVKGLSSQYSNTTVGLLVMIPYLVGLPVMILVGRSSDRRLERRYHAAIPLVIVAASLMLLGTTPSASVRVTGHLTRQQHSAMPRGWVPTFLSGFLNHQRCIVPPNGSSELYGTR